jgi:hypothetical protein
VLWKIPAFVKKTILIADDSSRERKDIYDLCKFDFEMICFDFGIDVVEYVEANGVSSFDGAILDYKMMPEGDNRLWDLGKQAEDYFGDAVARYLRSKGFDGPIAIRSSVADLLMRQVEGLDVLLRMKDKQDVVLLDEFTNILY